METHECSTDLEPDKSGLMSEPDFIELVRIVKRLPTERRDQLCESLLNDQFSRMVIELVRIVKRLPTERRDQLCESLLNDQFSRMVVEADALLSRILKEHTLEQL